MNFMSMDTGESSKASKEAIKSLNQENCALKSKLEKLMSQMSSLESLCKTVRHREQTINKKEKDLLEAQHCLKKDMVEFETIRSAKLADVMVKLHEGQQQLQKQRQMLCSQELHKEYKVQKNKKMELQRCAEQESIEQSNQVIARKSLQIKKLRACIGMKNAKVVQLNGQIKVITEKLKRNETDREKSYQEKVEIASLLEKSVQECAILSAHNLRMKQEIMLLKKESEKSKPTSEKDIETQKLSKKLQRTVLEDGSVLWSYPDGSRRREFPGGRIEIDYDNGDRKVVDPQRKLSEYFYKENGMVLITEESGTQRWMQQRA